MDTLIEIIEESDSNQLLLNPRMPLESQERLRQLTQVAENSLKLKKHVWLATSGSTATSESALKLVALSKEALLASARAVNEFMGVTPGDVWAQVLPRFHVGGLGILIRASLSGSKVVTILENQPWDVLEFYKEVSTNKCTLISLVPAQIYDLVSQKLSAPPGVRVVIVGGGRLEPDLYQRARALGWPLLPSYGMTETASMIFCASPESLNKEALPQMECLPHAQVKINEEGLICVKARSLLTCYAQMQEGAAKVWSPLRGGWLVTEDRGELSSDGLQIRGRHQDYVKIGGEGVNLAHLRSVLEECAMVLNPEWALKVALLDMPSPRLGVEIHLVSLLNESNTQVLLESYSQKVMPFEKVRKVYYNQEIPRSPLGKILWAELRKRL